MARSMSLDVLVRMKDLLSSPLRRLTQGLRQLAQVGRSIGIIGTAVAAISFMGPIHEAAAFQQKLIDIAATQNMVGKQAFAAVDDMKLQYEGLALEVGQLSDTVASGAGQMIAAGVDPKLIDVSIGRIGRAATAANAEFSDMAGVATSMLQSLQLPADQLDDSLAALVIAGKEGAFELKDMARYFPTLTSQMAKFGVTGREAVNFLGAALQIARKGTADPAEAANNLKNFLSKILAPATIKSFSKAGVDIEAVMRDAATKGINPIEAVMQKIVKLTGVSGGEIEKLMAKAKKNGLEGAEALGFVREQLEQIHGAGALGELFSDMQVMDFLIPFLSNVDEFKRIKGEVAKATGSMIDADFETQMQGLNRQLITFQEIGTQAWRDVGFAFGTWMPTINENLMAALKWLRELDASTGGMVKSTIAWAGAGILAAGALGAVSLALPVLGAGLSLLMTLLSPVGLLLAGLALAGMHVYKNWGTYGPRLMRVWSNLKTGMKGMLDNGRQLVSRYGPMIASSLQAGAARVLAAGRQMMDRYGPILKQGFASALRDIEAGWKNLQGFFEGFADGLDLKIDFSGLTIDNAKIAAFRALDAALNGIKGAWQVLKEFGTGFAQYLEPIGKNMGGTVSAVVDLASGMWRLARALAKLIPSMSSESAASIAKWLGGFTGGAIDLVTSTIKTLAGALAEFVNTLADVAEGKKGLTDLVPAGLLDIWKDLVKNMTGFIDAAKQLPGQMYDIGVQIAQRMYDGVKAKIDEMVAWFSGLSGRILDAIGTIDITSKIKGYFGFGDDEAPSPSNDNTANPEKKAELARPVGGTQLAAIQRLANQQVDVGGAITVKVDGPGTVTSVASTNKDVPLTTGRRTGRV